MEITPVLLITDLPDDALLEIFAYCSYRTLLTCMQVCKTFKKVINCDASWKRVLARCLNTPSSEESLKDMCTISFKWVNGNYHETTAANFQKKLLPWLQLDQNHLFVSKENTVQLYDHTERRRKAKNPVAFISVGADDVTRFVVKNNLMVTASKAIVSVWNTGEKPFKRVIVFAGHANSIYCVEILHHAVFSGSRDRSIKIWSMVTGRCLATINTNDSVKSLAVNPFDRTFVAGTAGFVLRQSALRLYDCETGHLLRELICDSSDRRGAGVLDLKFESPKVLLSCGYDTAVRLWDLRLDRSTCCVKKWEDPHDSAVYCIESDQRWMILSGTYRYGVVRLWDKRMDHSVKSYYVGGHTTSSVYSLKFNHTKLFVALDHKVNVLNFDLR